jgi:putative membrane protein
MNTPATPDARFEVRTTSDSHFGWVRTRLATERTLLAWLRTSVSLIGFGFTIVQFFERFSEMKGVAPAARPHAPRELGLMLIGAGIVTLMISVWQYRELVTYLWSDLFRPVAGLGVKQAHERPVIGQSAAMITCLLMLFIGLFAFVAVWTRAV